MTLQPPSSMVIFAIIAADSMVAANYVIFSQRFSADPAPIVHFYTGMHAADIRQMVFFWRVSDSRNKNMPRIES